MNSIEVESYQIVPLQFGVLGARKDFLDAPKMVLKLTSRL